MVALNTQHQTSLRGLNRRRGDTLTVVLVLIALAAVVAFLTLPSCGCGVGEKARIKAARQDVININTALETFKDEKGRYPTTAEGIGALLRPDDHWHMLFAKMPQDPWGHQYIYRSPGSHGEAYEIYCTGPSGQDGNSDNIHLP